MWPHVGKIQRDFAARIDWASKERFEDAEHAPSLKIAEGTDFEAAPGEKLVFHAEAASPDGAEVTVSYEIYKEASAACAAQAELSSEGCQAELTIPVNAAAGDCIHVVVKAEAGGHYRLVHYQQIIVRIR